MLGCRLGCPSGCDSIEHYALCPIVHRCWSAVAAPLASSYSPLTAFLRLDPPVDPRGADPSGARLRHAQALYALMGLLNRLRHLRLTSGDILGSFSVLFREGATFSPPTSDALGDIEG